jgi:hypothetical protein
MKPSNFIDWSKRLFSGQPHFIVGGHDDPYMLRWYLIPRNRLFNIYLHKFLRDDNDQALHDHPWWFVSFMLKGGYFEMIPGPNGGLSRSVIKRTAGSLAFRPATHRHRVVLFRNQWGRQPCWTIVVTGRAKRSWGFWCPKGFVPWKQFVAQNDEGDIGRGCGEMS